MRVLPLECGPLTRPILLQKTDSLPASCLLSVANSSSPITESWCSTLYSVMRLSLTWSCLSLVHVVTVTMCMYSVMKTLFLWNYLSLLSLRLLLPLFCNDAWTLQGCIVFMFHLGLSIPQNWNPIFYILASFRYLC